MDDRALFDASSLRIAGGYVLFASVWIVGSDTLLAFAFPDQADLSAMQTAKGIAFVLASALLILWMLRREAAARAARERDSAQLRAMVGGVEDHSFCELDAAGRVVSWYSSAVPSDARTDAEILGKHFERFFTPADRDAGLPRTMLADAERRGSVHSIGWRLRPDGKRYWAHCRLTALRDPDHRLRGFARVTHDISERQATAARLRTLENQLGFAESHGRIGFFEHDLVTDKVEFSDKALEIFGLAREAWVGVVAQWLKLVHPDDRVRMGVELERGLRTGGQFDMECRILRPDGEERIVYHLVVVDQDASGRPIRTSGTVIDVTERVRSRRAVERHRGQLAAIVGSAMDAIITVDAQQRIVQFNAAAETMFGVRLGDALGTSIERFIPNDVRARHHTHIQRFGSSGVSGRNMGRLGKVRALRADGREFPAEASISQIALDDERFYSVILRDLTDREAARQALEQSAARLQRLSLRLVRVQEQEQRRLARELHDGLGQVLTATKLRVLASLERAPELAAAVESLDQMLQQVRTMSLNLRPSMLDDLGLAATLRWYLNQQSTLGKFAVELDIKDLEQRLDADSETAAYRIVQEAITNVLRHAGARKVRVKAWRHAAEFELEISDDGRGFDPHARDNHGGLLGMRERAMLLGGNWVIHSAPGAGCTVRATLPLAGKPREVEA